MKEAASIELHFKGFQAPIDSLLRLRAGSSLVIREFSDESSSMIGEIVLDGKAIYKVRGKFSENEITLLVLE